MKLIWTETRKLNVHTIKLFICHYRNTVHAVYIIINTAYFADILIVNFTPGKQAPDHIAIVIWQTHSYLHYIINTFDSNLTCKYVLQLRYININYFTTPREHEKSCCFLVCYSCLQLLVIISHEYGLGIINVYNHIQFSKNKVR